MIEGRQAPCDEGLLRSGASTPCADSDKPWVLVASILGSSLAFVVGSVVNVALPAIQSGLGASAAQMQWVINAYLLTLGAFILVGGSLGDHLGRRRMFLLGTVVFTAASAWCGAAADTTQLVIARAIQGLGGALLVPSSLALISATFPAEERGRAIGTWAGFSALTSALGPVLGGWLVDHFSWRWVFYLVLPLALLALAITAWRVPESRDEDTPSVIDWLGAGLAASGLGLLTYGLIASAQPTPSSWVAAALVGGAVLVGAFLMHERRTEVPMMPLPLFRSSTFSGANLMTLLLYFALGGTLFFLPFNLIQVQGYSATQAGMAFLPFTLVMGVLSRWSGGLVDRFGSKKPLVAGPLVAAVGLALFAVPGVEANYWTGFFPAMLVLGLGMTVSVAPLTTVVMNAVSDQQAGTASGINNAAARIASLLAVAVLGAFGLSLFSQALDARLAQIDAPAPAEAAVWDARTDFAAATVPTDVPEEEQHLLQQAIHASFIDAFRIVMLAGAALAVLSALFAGLMVKNEAEE